MDFETTQQEIAKETGVLIPCASYTSDELANLLYISKQTPTKEGPIQIPSFDDSLFQSGKKRIDPRLVNPTYRRMWYNSIGAALSHADKEVLRTLNLELVLDLDMTLIHVFKPNVPNTSHSLNIEISKLSTEHPRLDFQLLTYVTSSGESIHYILTIRPDLFQILSSLKKIANLHIYTTGDQEYAHMVVRKIDPSNRLFTRVYGAGVGGEKSSTEKNLLNLFSIEELELVKGRVLILDDTVDVWREEDQMYVIPGMRFCPMYEQHVDYSPTNSRYVDGLRRYAFAKNIPAMYDEQFYTHDTKSEQLRELVRLFKKIHSGLYESSYAKPAWQLLQKHKRGFLKGVSVYLGFINEPNREDKIRNYTYLIECLGGTVSQEPRDSISLYESEISQSEAASKKNVTWLIRRFFLLDSKII